tara:strand:+ start:53 stop:319 length:267 start_codon:yes stop_codon:yes gene_type:complete
MSGLAPNIIDDSNTIKDKELPKLTPLQTKQLDFLMKEYPMLDQTQIESVLRITDEQRDSLVKDIKDGVVEHEKSLKPEEYIIEAVKVS